MTTLVLFYPITTLIFGAKWLVAKPLFLLLAFANVFVPTVTPLLGLFNALARPKLSLIFAIVRMLSTWAFGSPLILLYGSIGYALANALVQLTNLALLFIAKRLVPFRIVPTIWRVWLAAGMAGFAAFLVEQRLPAHSVSWLVGSCIR